MERVHPVQLVRDAERTGMVLDAPPHRQVCEAGPPEPKAPARLDELVARTV